MAPSPAACNNGFGFDGATAAQPWKRETAIAGEAILSVASMGPRLLSRGRPLGAERLYNDSTTSMGPRRLSRGRRRYWRGSARAGRASMGPRPIQPWKLSQPSCCNAATPLQWGHGAPWKPAGSWRTKLVRPRFNGATAFRPWKRVPETDEREAGEIASMGPRRLGRGNVTSLPMWRHGGALQWGHGV